MSTITHEQERTEEQRTYDDEVLERVKRGLAWLEETHGPGWEDKIDMKTLDIADGCHCVLGQIYDGITGETNGFAHAFYSIFGGHACDVTDLGFWGNNYSQLQACWEDVLTPRVKKDE